MLLLLDIDGVMVPANSWRRPEILADGFTEFSPKAIEALNKILSNIDTEIVLTTSHKFKYSLNSWLNIFKIRGINLTKINRLPENTGNFNRINELLNWFSSTTINDQFVILDDDKSLNALPEFLKRRLIQTNGSLGLTVDLANELLELVKGDNNRSA